MAQELGWSEEKQDEEYEKAVDFLPTMGLPKALKYLSREATTEDDETSPSTILHNSIDSAMR